METVFVQLFTLGFSDLSVVSLLLELFTLACIFPPIGSVLSRLLTTDDVTRRWACHRATVDRYRKAGLLRAVHVGHSGRLIRFRLEDIEAFEAANSHRGVADETMSMESASTGPAERKPADSMSATAKLARLRDREIAARNANRPA